MGIIIFNMRQITLIALCSTIMLTSSECNTDSDPLIGHMKLMVTYPEAVVTPDQPTYFIQVPGVGAEARLYDKDAECLGYKDVGLGRALIGDELAQCKYVANSNEKGEILFADIEAGEYYLTVYARQLYKYTQKHIAVPVGDTLKLIKDFTPSGSFFEDLEPWDYEMPSN